NASAMFALIQPGDTILGLNLAHGGHLTHGMRINFSGKLYKVVPYGVREDTMQIDMAEVERLAVENKPRLIVAGWSAYSRQLDFAEFRRIADLVGAYLMVDMAHFAGLVAAGLQRPWRSGSPPGRTSAAGSAARWTARGSSPSGSPRTTCAPPA